MGTPIHLRTLLAQKSQARRTGGVALALKSKLESEDAYATKSGAEDTSANAGNDGANAAGDIHKFKVGESVQFHVYADALGLGAEECSHVDSGVLRYWRANLSPIAQMICSGS